MGIDGLTFATYALAPEALVLTLKPILAAVLRIDGRKLDVALSFAADAPTREGAQN